MLPGHLKAFLAGFFFFWGSGGSGLNSWASQVDIKKIFLLEFVMWQQQLGISSRKTNFFSFQFSFFLELV